MKDMIYRQAAIDALGIEPFAFSEYENGLHDKWESDVEALMELPSAQPEPTTEIQEILKRQLPEPWRVEGEPK